MPFTIIKGTFHVLGYSPDGDSIRFKADDETNWARLSGPPVTLNARRHAQLRLEAIDTLETHYRNVQQPAALATDALDFLLRGLNITGVQWDVLRTRITQANDATEGYILSRTVEPNRRPVAFAFSTPAPGADGSSIMLGEELLKDSMNYKSLAAGLAYPTYYKGLFSDLRREMTAASTRARQDNAGVWAEDRTNTGFKVDSIQSITEEHVILPKLFRRLAEFLEGGGPVSEFKQFLADKEDGVTIISSAHFTHLDTLVEVNGDEVKMTQPPENLVFEG